MNSTGVAVAHALLFASSVFLLLLTAVAQESKPRIFITDSTSWEIAGAAGGSGGTFASEVHGGARPQTAEIIKTFGERCPEVVVNNKQEKADYIVVLDHEGGKGYLRRRNKVAVFNKDGDAIVSRSTRSLGNSVQDACEAIVKNWSGHSGSPSPASAAVPSSLVPVTKSQPEAKPTPVVPAAVRQGDAPSVSGPLPVAAVERSDSSTPLDAMGTVSITSSPDGAEIFIDSVGRGRAPVILKLAPGKHSVQLVMKDYKDWTSELVVKANSIVNVTATLEK